MIPSTHMRSRRRYVASFYGSRFWASPGTFTTEEADWHAEPFMDAEKLRAGFGNYESAVGRRELSAEAGLPEPLWLNRAGRPSSVTVPSRAVQIIAPAMTRMCSPSPSKRPYPLLHPIPYRPKVECRPWFSYL